VGLPEFRDYFSPYCEGVVDGRFVGFLVFITGRLIICPIAERDLFCSVGNSLDIVEAKLLELDGEMESIFFLDLNGSLHLKLSRETSCQPHSKRRSFG
jgi:hypothetical protein